MDNDYFEQSSRYISFTKGIWLLKESERMKIEEVDKPSEFKAFLESLKDLDEKKYSSKFQTKKNYHLLSDVKIFEDSDKNNLLQATKFEYSDAKLNYYFLKEENNPASEYIIDYSKSISKESII